LIVVVDASAVLEVLLNRPRAALLRERLFRPDEVLHAPHLLDLEVMQALRRHWLVGELDEDHAGRAIRYHLDFPIKRHAHDLFLARVWELRFNFTAYDAMYVALAEALRATLITSDARLAKAARRFVSVEVP
jgi:predicted nucleic acid-binding protein